MGKQEASVVDYLVSKKEYLFILFITIFAILIRVSVFNYNTTDDYITFLHPWYEQIDRYGGLPALRHQVGNYSITYQFFIALFTYLPGKDLFWYKSFSAFFDFVLALSAGRLCQLISNSGSKKFFIFTYAIVLFLPTVVFNSSLWAQCDSIYVSFILMSIINLLNRKYKTSFALLGVALAFKLQTIFILPFFILVYAIRKSFSCSYFLISIVSFYLCCLPGFIYGRSLFDPIKIYMNQSDSMPSLNVGYPNFSGLFGIINANEAQLWMLHRFLMFLTLAVLCIGLMIVFEYERNFSKLELVYLALWINWTCVMFLPNMHDRYGFFIDLLLVLLSIATKNRLMTILATISIINSFIVYCEYIFRLQYHLLVLSYIAVIIYMIFSLQLYRIVTSPTKES
ncbi:hypothetical protein LMC10_04200 [Limosilactobacillus reuteri]|uniref:hypothetical protein n=1 Tax=Limosilactobacillus reuteri TaxID=1598 RepID=UPI001E523895|nr:hypothetical protein [Limosilactobacillus reuteri]MCC4399291.1 hypothetical protein [Limosilactobacillus reuteri]MCC4403450.1 hypothetical protein [Limosilactobacillus reuteri]